MLKDIAQESYRVTNNKRAIQVLRLVIFTFFKNLSKFPDFQFSKTQ